MSSLIEMLTQQLGSQQNVGQLSRQLGTDHRATENALGAALPVLLTALARNSAETSGAESLDRALSKHDGSVLDNLGGFLEAPDVDDGDGILRHVLGDRRESVESGVSRASGLDMSMVAKLLPMLAPIVMGALGKQKRENGLNSAGLSELLGSERQRMEQSSPAAGMLGKLLDQDGDGSIADDVAKLGTGLLGGLFGKR
ncbi:MAG: DUF937 domain-containing protein [Gemmatimonadales bacterium]|jgi:hypothetical protein